MRILMILDSSYPPDIRVEKEAETLAAAGHDVHVLCYRHARTAPRHERVRGVTVHRIWVPREIAKKALGLIFHLPVYRVLWHRAVRRWVRTLQPAAVHVHDLPAGWPVWQALRGIGPGEGRPLFVLDLHENYPELLRDSKVARAFPQKLFFDLQRWKKLERTLVQAADHVVVVSDYNRERLIDECGREGPVTVVSNAVRLDAFAGVSPSAAVRQCFDRPGPGLLYVGGLDPTRGLGTVLEGLARLANSPAHLVLVGAGSSRGTLEEQVQRLGLQDRVQFVGQVSQQEVGAFCQCADVCLLPLNRSRQTEHADPNKLYQYAYFSKPVLAAGTTSLMERVAEMGCGLTYRPDDPDHFSAQLAQLLKDPQQLQAYGERGRAAVVSRYNWQVASRALLRLYGGQQVEESEQSTTAEGPVR